MIRHLFPLLIFLTISGLADAAGPPTSDDNGNSVDFSVRLARAKTSLDYGSQDIDTTIRWLGLSLREKVSKHVTLGMYGGYAYVTQTDNPVTQGIELNGYHAGFTLLGFLYTSQRATLYYTLDYAYQKVDHKGATQTVVIDWFDSRAEIGGLVALTGQVRLYGGGGYGYLDGEERDSGTVNSTKNFKGAERVGGFIGLDLKTDPSGHVGIEARAGMARRVEIYFKRSY